LPVHGGGGILPPNSPAARCRTCVAGFRRKGGDLAANRQELHMKRWATLFLAAGLIAPGAAWAQAGAAAGVQVGPVGVGAGVGTNGVGAGAHVGTVGANAGVGVGVARYHRCRGGWYWHHHHRVCRRW
jgi:hypothetical protein